MFSTLQQPNFTLYLKKQSSLCITYNTSRYKDVYCNFQLFAGKFFCRFLIQNILLVLNFAFVLGTVKFNDIHCSFPPKLIFAVLEQIAEIANISTCKNL